MAHNPSERKKNFNPYKRVLLKSIKLLGGLRKGLDRKEQVERKIQRFGWREKNQISRF